MHINSVGADMFVRRALTRDAFKIDFAHNAYAQCNKDGISTVVGHNEATLATQRSG